MSDTQILDLIQKAKETKATRLNLSNRKLSELPPEIGQLSELQVLWLNGNRFEQLPPEIGQLRNLRRLRLHKNHLAALPPEIGQLTELRDLTLYSNQLIALPPQIGNLHKLQRLITADNKISKLPDEIAQLSELRELNLGNQLRKRKRLVLISSLGRIESQIDQRRPLAVALSASLCRIQRLKSASCTFRNPMTSSATLKADSRAHHWQCANDCNPISQSFRRLQ